MGVTARSGGSSGDRRDGWSENASEDEDEENPRAIGILVCNENPPRKCFSSYTCWNSSESLPTLAHSLRPSLPPQTARLHLTATTGIILSRLSLSYSYSLSLEFFFPHIFPQKAPLTM